MSDITGGMGDISPTILGLGVREGDIICYQSLHWLCLKLNLDIVCCLRESETIKCQQWGNKVKNFRERKFLPPSSKTMVSPTDRSIRRLWRP
jgi:hypothetical protein